MNKNVSKNPKTQENKGNSAKMLMLPKVKNKQIGVDPIHFSALCLSSPTACSLLHAFTEDRAASSPGVTWHAVLVWFDASAGDANLFCLWLSFAVGCLSLFFDQIKLDGFHNCISATEC